MFYGVTFTKKSLARMQDGVSKGKIPPGDAVKMPGGLLTSVDNRRVVVAQQLGKALNTRIRNFDDALGFCAKRRFNKKGKPPNKTWGDAVKSRVQGQGKPMRRDFPEGSPKMPKIKIK